LTPSEDLVAPNLATLPVEDGLASQETSATAALSAFVSQDPHHKTFPPQKKGGLNKELPAPPPNVLFLLADDLRPQLGVYGNRAHTPSLDRLGREGVTFENAFAQITVCNPSRASFLSGRRPDTTEIYGFEATTPEGWTTLPAFFRRNGYTTFGVGKLFHWGPGPEDAWTTSVKTWAAPSNASSPLVWEVPSGLADKLRVSASPSGRFCYL